LDLAKTNSASVTPVNPTRITFPEGRENSCDPSSRSTKTRLRISQSGLPFTGARSGIRSWSESCFGGVWLQDYNYRLYNAKVVLQSNNTPAGMQPRLHSKRMGLDMATYAQTKLQRASGGNAFAVLRRPKTGKSILIIGLVTLGLSQASDPVSAQGGPGTCTAVKRASKPPKPPHCVLTHNSCVRPNKPHMTVAANGCNCVCAP